MVRAATSRHTLSSPMRVARSISSRSTLRRAIDNLVSRKRASLKRRSAWATPKKASANSSGYGPFSAWPDRGADHRLELRVGPRRLRHRARAPGGVPVVGGLHRPPDARHRLLPQPPLLGRQRRHHAHVHGAHGGHLRADTVPAVGAGVQPARGRGGPAPDVGRDDGDGAHLGAHRRVGRHQAGARHGAADVAVALTLQSLLQVDTATVVIILMSMLLGLGMSNVMAPATESIMGSLPRAKAGVGSAVNDTTRQMGGALGVALIGSLLSTRYQSDVDAGLGGARNVSSELLDHVGANVQAGVNIGRGTPAPLGDRIVDVAHHAFLSGYHLAVLVAAGITLLAAIGVFRWLPARAATPTEAPAPDEARADGDEAQGLEPAIEGATSG